jgi:hypothetical protein
MTAGAPIRRCPECGEEFLPHVVQCSDCGATLESGFEGETPSAQGGGVAAPAPAAEYVGLVSRLTPETAQEAAGHLTEAAVPFVLVSDSRRGLRLGVAPERVADAIGILERAGLAPMQPDSGEAAVAAEGGPCPACGENVAPGSVDCPGCGLSLAAAAVPCRHCGGELHPGFDACPDCGRGQD